MAETLVPILAPVRASSMHRSETGRCRTPLASVRCSEFSTCAVSLWLGLDMELAICGSEDAFARLTAAGKV